MKYFLSCVIWFNQHIQPHLSLLIPRWLSGSSLGGYFASLVSNETGCPAVLLNPSAKPHVSLQRFVNDTVIDSIACDDNNDTVIYHATGGWGLL